MSAMYVYWFFLYWRMGIIYIGHNQHPNLYYIKYPNKRSKVMQHSHDQGQGERLKK